jgi:peptide/nickel transport system permease protein
MDGHPAMHRGGDRGLAAALVAVAFVFAFILLAPLVLPLDPEAMSPEFILAPPSLEHWGGTDNLGRDILTRTLMGARSTLTLALAATLLGVGLGALIGMVAGYRGGFMDKLSMRLADAVMALPSLVLAMLSLVVFGNGPGAVLGAIAIVFLPRAARIMRSVVLDLATRDFVVAASVIGESQASILLREILPNMWPNLLVEACLRFSYAILLISSLGYLGIGVQPPTPDWGLMIADSSAYITTAPWMVVWPAAGIVVSVVTVNLLGDRLQERFAAWRRGRMSHV